jgi:hypothetical protein
MREHELDARAPIDPDALGVRAVGDADDVAGVGEEPEDVGRVVREVI